MSKQISTTVVGNANQIYKAVIACMNAGVVPYIIGSPGVGKSSVVREIAKKNNLKLIDVRLSLLESCDLNGFPQIDKEADVATYVPFDIFPVTTDAIPEGYSGWLLFLDELPSADRAVIKGFGADDPRQRPGNIRAVVDIGRAVARANADGRLSGGIGRLHHAGSSGGQDQPHWLRRHQRLTPCQNRDR